MQCMHGCVPVYQYTSVPVYQYTSILVYQYTSVPVVAQSKYLQKAHVECMQNKSLFVFFFVFCLFACFDNKMAGSSLLTQSGRNIAKFKSSMSCYPTPDIHLYLKKISIGHQTIFISHQVWVPC